MKRLLRYLIVMVLIPTACVSLPASIRTISTQFASDEISISTDIPTASPTGVLEENSTLQFTYHVAVNGDDSNPGTSDKPFATIERARDVIRTISAEMTEPINVKIHGGIYEIIQPVKFSSVDSGQNGFDIVYRAAEGEIPIFSGGKSVTNWEKDPDSLLWSTKLPLVNDFRQLYVNGIRAQRALADGLLTGTRSVAGDFSRHDGISIASEKLPFISRPQDLELHWITDWKDMRLPVRDIEDEGDGTKTIWMEQPYYSIALQEEGHFDRKPLVDVPFYMENAIELINEPGEWYFDSETSMLFYYPRDGENLRDAEVVIPQTQTLLEISGSVVGDEVHNIIFKGLSFKYAGWNRANEVGTINGQAQYLVSDTNLDGEMTPAHVVINSAHDIRFERCRFAHLGAAAMHLNNNVFNVTVQGNLFQDISDGAIVVGHWDHAYITEPLTQAAPANNLIVNNLITDIGIEYWSAPAVTAYYVNGLQVMHNEISHTSYTGISVGWGWSEKLDSVTAHDNIISHNLITDITQRARDAGGIYTLGQQPGTIIENNVVRRMKDEFACYYPDEGSAFMTLKNNVCDSAPYWLYIWTSSIHDIKVINAFTNIQKLRNDGIDNTIEEPVFIEAQNWTQEAQAIINDAGLEPAYAYLYDWLE